MTLREAKKLTPGQIILSKYLKNADGTPWRWKVNGEVKRWKRDKDRIKIPLKRGQYNFAYLDNTNLNLFTLKKEIAKGRS